MFKFSNQTVKSTIGSDTINNCSVRAVANAKGVTYQEAYTTMQSLGRKDNQPIDIRKAAAGCMRQGGKLFITEILNDTRLKSGNYVVFTQQHCFAVKDGVIFDDVKPDLNEKLMGVFKF